MDKHLLSNVAFGAYEMPVEPGGGDASFTSTLMSLGSNVYGLVSSAAASAGTTLSALAAKASAWTELNTLETYHDFLDFVERRKTLWAKINAMPSGSEKEKLLADFRSTETLVQGTALPLGSKFFELLGYPKVDTGLGALPILGLAAIGAALYAILELIYTHYGAMERNPALADSGVTGGIAKGIEGVGKGVQGMLWAVGIVAAIAFIVPMLKQQSEKVKG